MNAFENKVGLVLPGGGARGAYQIGVLKGITEILADRTINPFSVISGTSVGAINASVIASKADSFVDAVDLLNHIWGTFQTNRVYKTDNLTMFKSSLHWLVTLVSGGTLVKNPKSLLNNSPLRTLLMESINLDHIRSNIDEGHLEAFAITAAGYSSRKSITFFQSNKKNINWEKFRRQGVESKIGTDHLMASVALPLIFPAVKIDNEFFGDGAMRHATPLSPAIRLGAEKLLIITTDNNKKNPDTDDRDQPSIGEIGGYMLDALFSSGLLSDLERLDRINQIIKHSSNGPINTASKQMKHLDYCIISPSKDINLIAEEHFNEIPYSIKLLLRGLGLRNQSRSELLSFLLFESSFTQELIKLGFQDAIEHKQHIKNIFQ
jgi:NTE family protein